MTEHTAHADSIRAIIKPHPERATVTVRSPEERRVEQLDAERERAGRSDRRWRASVRDRRPGLLEDPAFIGGCVAAVVLLVIALL